MSTQIEISRASSSDLATIVDLLTANIPHVSEHTLSALPQTWPTYFVARCPAQGNALIGAASLQRLDEGRAEIRGLAVDENQRGCGIARMLVERLLDEARSEQLSAVCVTRRPEFFRRFGFEETSPSWLHLRSDESKRWTPRVAKLQAYSSRMIEAPRVAMACGFGAMAC